MIMPTDEIHPVRDRFLDWCRQAPPGGKQTGGPVSDTKLIGQYIRTRLTNFPKDKLIWCWKFPGDSLPKPNPNIHHVMFGEFLAEQYKTLGWWVLVFVKGNPVHGELQLNHLATSSDTRIEGPIVSASSGHLKEIRSAMRIAKSDYKAGRPVGTSFFANRSDFSKQLFPLIHKHGPKASKESVAIDLGHDPRVLLRWLQAFGWSDWSALVKEAEQSFGESSI
jgi:hypothetical protein